MFDETTNKACEKDLQIRILYWSSSHEEVCVRHLQTYFVQHAKATDIVSHLHKAISDCKLDINYLLMIGSDGPNVNKKVKSLLNTELMLTRKTGLMDIGTCNLHVINNAFLKAIEKFGVNIVDLLTSVHYFFKDKPSRIADYQYCQKKKEVPKHSFIKHVPSRWLTLHPAAARLLEQWPAVLEYFLNYILKENKSIA